MQAVGIRYWNAIRNCGDSISSDIIEQLIGLQPMQVGSDVEHVLCVGSVLSLANPKSHLWGTGILNQKAPVRRLVPGQIAALRGRKTLEHLRGMGFSVADVPLGDPGLLVRRLPAVQRWISEAVQHGARYRVAIVPHYSSINHPVFQELAQRSDVVIVDMRDNTLKPLQLIAQSEAVISQSLHGLIFAEAMGKPSVWISATSEEEWKFKYLDWYSNVKNPPAAPVLLGDLSSRGLESVLRAAEVREILVRDDDLLSVFPGGRTARYEVEGLIDYNECRAKSPHTVIDNDFPAFDAPLLADVPDDVLLTAFGHLERRLKDWYQNWAERPFTLFCRPGFEPDAALAHDLRAILEDRRATHLLCVARERDVPREAFAAPPVLHWSGRRIIAGTGVLGVAAMVRPNMTSREMRKAETVLIEAP